MRPLLHSVFVRVWLICLGCLIGMPAMAIEGDDLLVRVSTGLQYESNLFRLPEDAVVPGLESRSDLIAVTSAGFSFERPWSAQVFRASMSVVDRHYADYTQLNGLDHDILLGWRLLHRDRDSFDLTVNQSRQTLGFADARVPGRPIVDTFAIRAGGAFEFVPRWSALAGIGFISTDNSPPSRSVLDYELNYFETGVRYDWRTGSVFDFVWRRQSAEFAQPAAGTSLVNNGYDEDLVGVRMTWQLTEATQVSGRLGIQHRDYRAPALKSQTGPGANLSLVWQPRGAWRVDASIRSELSAAAEINASYAQLNGISVTATWLPTAKTQVRAGFDVLDRAFQQTAAASLVGPARHDLIGAVYAGVSVQPWRTVQVSADWRFERRDSNQDAFDYRANTVFVRIGVVF